MTWVPAVKNYREVKLYGANLIKISSAIILSAALLLNGCTSSRVVKPLNQGQWQATFGIGGPVIKNHDSNSTLPLAFNSASAAYGVSQSTTGFLSAGISSGFSNEPRKLRTVRYFDIGFTHELISPFHNQPGITFTPQLNIFRDKSGIDTTFYPQLDVNAYWLSAFRQDFFYVGMSNWFEPKTTKAHQQNQKEHWIPSIHGGYTFQGNTYGLNLELKYIAPNKNNRNQLFEYVGIENKGVIGGYLSISRKFKWKIS